MSMEVKLLKDIDILCLFQIERFVQNPITLSWIFPIVMYISHSRFGHVRYDDYFAVQFRYKLNYEQIK